MQPRADRNIKSFGCKKKALDDIYPVLIQFRINSLPNSERGVRPFRGVSM